MTTINVTLDDQTLEALADRVASRVRAGQEPWLNADQAATYLACPVSRIHDLVKLGEVQVARDGRRLLFRREWLDRVPSR